MRVNYLHKTQHNFLLPCGIHSILSGTQKLCKVLHIEATTAIMLRSDMMAVVYTPNANVWQPTSSRIAHACNCHEQWVVPSKALTDLGSNITVVVQKRPSPSDSVSEMSRQHGIRYIVQECNKQKIFLRTLSNWCFKPTPYIETMWSKIPW